MDTEPCCSCADQLMEALGYEGYGVQGGDMGAMIAPDIGRIVAHREIGK
ncbi:hypothetical protein [Paenibacillus sp. UNC496MF]|nr:hypothetical protein [Paenibacillus sp. UNC496MF]